MTRIVAVGLVLALAGCATVPSSVPTTPAFDAAAAVAAIRAAGATQPTELEVQPLQDPLVVDLREQAVRAEAAGRLVDAAAALDRALAERPDDPASLQARAEIALLQHRLDDAEAFARRAHGAGPRVGPACRRALETQVQVARIRAAPGDTTATARVDALVRERDACTVKPPPRY